MYTHTHLHISHHCQIGLYPVGGESSFEQDRKISLKATQNYLYKPLLKSFVISTSSSSDEEKGEWVWGSANTDC